MEAVSNKQYQCNACLSQFKGRPDEEKLLAAVLEQKACTKRSERVLHKLSDGFGDIRFFRCPGNYVSGTALALVPVHDAFEKGVAPYAGGYMDQPEKILEAFAIIGSWKAETQKKAHEKAMKEARRSRGR